MKDFFKLRKELYKQSVRSVELILGKESLGMRRYRQKYEKIFEKKWKPCQRVDFLSALNKKHFIFISDFHALQQSQRAQLRLLKSIDFQNKPIIALECIDHRFQKYVDKYIAGQLLEKEFLRKVKWSQTWGFPWEWYKPIFVWAKENQLKVLALNKGIKSHDAKTLTQRDHFAARLIAQEYSKNKQQPVFICYGDLHLAPQHLPGKLIHLLNLKSSDYAVILQNSEKIYFQMLKKQMDLQVDVVQMTKNYFCLQSVPPWVKWQNYLLFLESLGDESFYNEGPVDFTDYVKKSVEILSKDLKLKINLDPIAVYTADDDELWNKICIKFTGSARLWFKKKIAQAEPFYIPELQLGYLGRPTVNQAAILAAQIVHAELAELKITSVNFPTDFERWIWLEAVTYFCSKLINPKRKTDTIMDIKNQLIESLPEKQKRLALRLALSQKMCEFAQIQNATLVHGPVNLRSNAVYGEASRLLGGMLGEKLYHAYRKKWLKQEELKRLLSKPIDQTDFKKFYLEVLKKIDNWPEPFVSKSHKM